MASQPVCCRGDKNDGGGALETIKQSSFFDAGKLVSVDGSEGTTHPTSIEHSQGIWKTAQGSQAFSVENKPVNFVTNSDTCGHKRAEGSGTFFIG